MLLTNRSLERTLNFVISLSQSNGTKTKGLVVVAFGVTGLYQMLSDDCD